MIQVILLNLLFLVGCSSSMELSSVDNFNKETEDSTKSTDINHQGNSDSSQDGTGTNSPRQNGDENLAVDEPVMVGGSSLHCYTTNKENRYACRVEDQYGKKDSNYGYEKGYSFSGLNIR